MRMTLLLALGLLVMVPGTVSVAASAESGNEATCKGLIGTMDAATRSKDPTGPQAYIKLADELFVAANQVVVGRGMVPLLLPPDEDAEARRLMAIVNECKFDMTLTYSDAALRTYVALRRSAGLSVDFTAK